VPFDPLSREQRSAELPEAGSFYDAGSDAAKDAGPDAPSLEDAEPDAPITAADAYGTVSLPDAADGDSGEGDSGDQ
jgi:hypothetical protein